MSNKNKYTSAILIISVVSVFIINAFITKEPINTDSFINMILIIFVIGGVYKLWE